MTNEEYYKKYYASYNEKTLKDCLLTYQKEIARMQEATKALTYLLLKREMESKNNETNTNQSR